MGGVGPESKDNPGTRAGEIKKQAFAGAWPARKRAALASAACDPM
jgi:hypothetical protein